MCQKGWFSNIRANHLFGKTKTKFECPVIAVTAYQSSDIEDQAKKVGIKKVLYKPVDVD